MNRNYNVPNRPHNMTLQVRKARTFMTGLRPRLDTFWWQLSQHVFLARAGHLGNKSQHNVAYTRTHKTRSFTWYRNCAGASMLPEPRCFCIKSHAKANASPIKGGYAELRAKSSLTPHVHLGFCVVCSKAPVVEVLFGSQGLHKLPNMFRRLDYQCYPRAHWTACTSFARLGQQWHSSKRH